MQSFEHRMTPGTLGFSIGAGMTAGAINPRVTGYSNDRLRFARQISPDDTVRVRVSVKEVTEDGTQAVSAAKHLLLVERREVKTG